MDYKKLFWIVPVIVLFATCWFIYVRVVRGRKIMNELAELLVKRDFTSFDRLVNDPKAVVGLPQFNVDYLVLNRTLMGNDPKMIDEAFQRFAELNLNRNQKREISASGFAYYISKKNREKCRYYLEMMEDSSADEEMLRSSRDYYEIMFEGKTDSLERLLAETAKLPEKDRGSNEYLISVIYRNLNENEKAEEYEKRYAAHLKGKNN